MEQIKDQIIKVLQISSQIHPWKYRCRTECKVNLSAHQKINRKAWMGLHACVATYARDAEVMFVISWRWALLRWVALDSLWTELSNVKICLKAWWNQLRWMICIHIKHAHHYKKRAMKEPFPRVIGVRTVAFIWKNRPFIASNHHLARLKLILHTDK